MEIRLRVEVPTVPNFLKVEGTETSFDISAFSEEELKSIGEEWIQALIEKSKKRKQDQENYLP